MDRREPPRIGSVDASPLDLDAAGPSRPTSRRFARLVGSPTARRLVVSKVGRAGVAAAILLGLLVVAGSSLTHSLVKWLHGNSIYQVNFRDIQLIPEPPQWIKPGRIGLLEQVRDGREHFQSFSMADLDLDRLLTDFRRNPWVARAARATKAYPNKVTVYLAYLEPVAFIRQGKETYTVDREAIVLVQDDLDLQHAGHLIEIIAAKPRGEPRPGLAWPDEADPSRAGRLEPSSRVALAARLAGFFKQRIPTETSTEPLFLPDKIFANDGQGLFVMTREKTLIFWGHFQDIDAPGELTDSAKCDMLMARSKAGGGLKVKEKEYLNFERDKIRVGRFP